MPWHQHQPHTHTHTHTKSAVLGSYTHRDQSVTENDWLVWFGSVPVADVAARTTALQTAFVTDEQHKTGDSEQATDRKGRICVAIVAAVAARGTEKNEDRINHHYCSDTQGKYRLYWSSLNRSSTSEGEPEPGLLAEEIIIIIVRCGQKIAITRTSSAVPI